MAKLIINGKNVEVPDQYTILEAANTAGIDIPRLCFLKGINENSSCRLCVVEIKGIKTLKNSCTVKVSEGMVITTNSDRVKRTVKRNLELIAANHKFECWKCTRENNCELLRLLRKYNIPNNYGENPTFEKKPFLYNITESLVIDSSKCVLCGRCIEACKLYSGLNVLDYNHRGFDTYVGPALNHSMENAGCIYCGKCIQACPVGAIKEKEDIDEVFELLDNDNVYKVVQIAPAVRASIGEEFGYPIGTNVEKKLFHALKLLGFDDITDTNFAADVTIMEEGTEFIKRLKDYVEKGIDKLPLFTSCSPGWIRYIETYYPEFIPHLSSCKSPQQMQGALIKHYYANKMNIDKNKIKVVSIMPCIAKKYEAKKPEMQVDGIRDVDLVITTRELARLIRRKDISFSALEGYTPSSPLAQYTGAAALFGATGGVMEAALRTIKELLEEKPLECLEFNDVRGVEDGIKEAQITIAGKEFSVAVVHGASNMPEIFKRIKENDKKYAFIEFMACTGGCINGGGQPIIPSYIVENIDVRKLRAKALYQIDHDISIRQSHKNPEVINIYNQFLEYPGSHTAHKLLHTKYEEKTKYSV
ncbi:MAG: NADH-dependent [FeFe] hydrogenase, group A6 [Bacilli bacterium]|jgi:iron-only hydrogenase group A|nr:NADH-dependent [FeFe] hydrogenase, group A6 [Bacilli bacterium]